MRRSFLPPLLLLLATLASAGCGSLAPDGVGACTRIGCDSGAFFELDGPLPESYTVTLLIPGEPPRVAECAPADVCGGRVFFAGVTARQVEIEITGEGGLRLRREVSLTYATSRPNGPDCPPVCLQAFARVQL
jgi:hypothetical protein